LALAPPLRRWPILLATGFILVMSAQIFAYVIDVPSLYAIAKIWPIVAAPFALVVLLRHKVDYALLFLLLLLYGLLVPPVISLFTLGNNAVGAVSTTVKLVAFANYFSTAGLLLLFRPTLSETRGVIFGLGLLTFGILWLLWIIEPLSAYSFSLDNSYIFFNDLERGPRIYAPMYFGFLLMFAINRSFWRRPGWWQLPRSSACSYVSATARWSRFVGPGCCKWGLLWALPASPCWACRCSILTACRKQRVDRWRLACLLPAMHSIFSAATRGAGCSASAR
jgi:hypothetical protein